MMKVKIENATDTYYVDDVTNYTNAINKLESLLDRKIQINRICQVDEYGEEFGIVEFDNTINSDKEKTVINLADNEFLIRNFVKYIEEYYSQPKYQPTEKDPIKHTQINFLKCKLHQLADEFIKNLGKNYD